MWHKETVYLVHHICANYYTCLYWSHLPALIPHSSIPCSFKNLCRCLLNVVAFLPSWPLLAAHSRYHTLFMSKHSSLRSPLNLLPPNLNLYLLIFDAPTMVNLATYLIHASDKYIYLYHVAPYPPALFVKQTQIIQSLFIIQTLQSRP